MKITSRRAVPLAFILLMLLAAAEPAVAQGTVADYQRARGLEERFSGLDIDVAQVPVWIGESSRFWYRKSVSGGQAFVLVDAENGNKADAFDHERVAAALAAVLPDEGDEPITAVTLPFNRIEFVDDESAIEFAIDNAMWRCELAEYACESTGRPARRDWLAPRERDMSPILSPDGEWEALINNYNVVVREAGSDELIRMSLDGSEGDAYELSSIVWSPDSAKLAAYRVQPGYRREVHYVESSPEDQLQPKHSTRVYAKPGDRLDKEMPVLFDVATHTAMPVDGALFPNAYSV